MAMHSSIVSTFSGAGVVRAAGAAWATATVGRSATSTNSVSGTRRIIIRILHERIRLIVTTHTRRRLVRGRTHDPPDASGRDGPRAQRLRGGEHVLGEELEHAGRREI